MIFKWFWVTLSPLIHEPYRMKMNVIYFWSLKLVEDLNSVYPSYDTTWVQQNISNCSRLTYVCINLVGTNLMGHNSIQPWHYGFCDLSHAQSAVKESKKAAQAAHTTAAWWRWRRRRLFRWKKAVRASKAWPGRRRHGWHGGQFWWDTVSWMELARFSFFSTGGVKSHSFIAQLNCKWFHELLLLLFTVV